jgi:quercetin dioxygenase-like cupin family protein
MKRYDALSMEMMEGWLDSGLAFHLQGRFGLHGPEGARRSAMQFLQVEDGERIAGEIAPHETMLLVLDGEVEVSTGDDRHTAERGSVAVIPPYVRYGIHNASHRPAHLLCLLPRRAVEAVFLAPLKPLHIRVLDAGRNRTEPLAS